MADETLRRTSEDAPAAPTAIPSTDPGEQQAKPRRSSRRTATTETPAGAEAAKPRATKRRAVKAEQEADAPASLAGPPDESPTRPARARRRTPRQPEASSDSDTFAEPAAPAPELQADVPRPALRRAVQTIDLTAPASPRAPRPPEPAPDARENGEPRANGYAPNGQPAVGEPGRRKKKRRKKDKDRFRDGAPGNGQLQGPREGNAPREGYAAREGPPGPRDNRPREREDAYREGRQGHRADEVQGGEPFEGMLELIGDKKFGFIRAIGPSLQKGDNDPFMPPPLIQKYDLRDGVALKGTIGRGRKGAWQVTRVDEVMGLSPEDWKETQDFDVGTTIYPDEKLNLITGPSDVSMRVIDLVAPVGKGQRALIVAPPRAGKTILLKKIAAGITQNHPEVELVALLIDERPEEVTDFKRNTAARVFASSNDHGEDNHIRVATLAFEYCRRLVEVGKDVVLLLDSLTRLGRTFNLWGGNSGRTMSGGLDARALLIPRKIFGAARNIEHGGSLTVIGTALIETNSRMDEVIFEEFKGTGNAEVVLDRELADKRIYPAINIRKSGTRNEERLMPEEQVRQRHMLFRVLNARHPVEAMQALLRQIQLSPTNVHLLNELVPEQSY